MMELFYEKQDFFQLKELEKSCQKEKGITSMSVKEILTSLVDDAMVDTEKIGTSVYFWAFPSKASQNRKRKIDELSGQLVNSKSKRRNLESQLKSAKLGKDDTQERGEILSKLSQNQEKLKEVEKELLRYRECDPEVMEQMKEDTQISKDAANRWTDNIFSITSWIKRKFSFDDATIYKQFGLPEELDYLD